ncbi:hypothetical protein BDZ91DRAFT_827663 [Kalaharituber pfeilii]|nr:hypothetical protein BDZ91DRAFT_827663 [Kalaharituber pfeilii]
MEAELNEYRLQLESVEAALKGDPDNTELANLAAELKEVIALTETVLAEERGATAPASSNAVSTASTNAPDRRVNELKRDSPSTSVDNTAAGTGAVHSFTVGDNVLARWTSGDNAFYPARITSITGSQTNPVYIVKFTSYNVSETLSSQHIKPLSDSQQKKRKLDATLTTSPAPVNSAIISQPANINAALAEQSKREPSKVSDGPPRPPKISKRVKHQRELNESKNKWQAFAAKGVKTGAGKAKKIGETSMFRTPEGVHGRVGFTGSGQPMRKEISVRGKHIYQQGDVDEE